MEQKKEPSFSTAPDGGWGWFIVFAFSLNNMVVIPTVQLFGLLYKDLLDHLNMTSVEINTIIATNCSFGMLLAIFNGPVLRKYGFRKIAIFGVLLIFVGNLLTSQSSSFWQFILFFGFIVSIGMNLAMAAFHLALNTYFVIKRGVATGIAMSITGIGPIIMPLIVSFLMGHYGDRGSGIILSAIALHSLIGACLLQPVKWHKKKVGQEKKNEQIELCINNVEKSNNDVDAIKEQNHDLKPETEDDVMASTKLMDDTVLKKSKLTNVSKSNDDESSSPLKSLDDIVRRREDTVLERVIKFFDFDLLRDPVFINISLGLSIAFVSEMNFTLMLPFILKERSFDTDRIAVLLSILAGADIISRFVSPFFGQSVKSKVRIVYLLSLMSGIFCRICFLYSYSFFSTIIVIFALGVTKGIRTVYTTLVIPTYVPLQKLASATGLQMVNNGLIFIVFGPLMGVVKQLSNYTIWIHVINCFTICTITMWFTEIHLLRARKKQKKPPIVIKNER